uniref:Cadherin domain-containing protein n=1 Tax=Timema genevievae TaxID=629358 RepID=A0A7R9JPF7_TIMGE|nr:unnamed protein product [Timema genevievae]
MVKIQLTDVNDNPPLFYPRQYNVSLREGTAVPSAAVVAVAASDPDSGRYGTLSYRIVAGNEAGMFRIERSSGEIFVLKPAQLSTSQFEASTWRKEVTSLCVLRSRSTYHLNVSVTDGGGLRAPQDAEVFLSVVDPSQTSPVFERTRYSFSVREDVNKGTGIGAVRATVTDTGKLINHKLVDMGGQGERQTSDRQQEQCRSSGRHE